MLKILKSLVTKRSIIKDIHILANSKKQKPLDTALDITLTIHRNSRDKK